MRLEMVIKGLKREAFMEYLQHFEKQMDDKEMKHIRELTVVERTSDGMPSIIYSKSKMPMMTMRENLISMEKMDIDDGRVLFLIRSVEHPKYPITKEAIRMQFYKASCSKQVGDDLHVLEFSNFNMGGYFPTKLLNMVMANMMAKGIGNFVRKVKEV